MRRSEALSSAQELFHRRFTWGQQKTQQESGVYTRSRLPVELAYYESYEDRHEALSREWHLKRLPREEKLALIGNGREESK